MLKRLTLQVFAVTAAAFFGCGIGAWSYLATLEGARDRDTVERFMKVAVFNIGSGAAFSSVIALVVSTLAIGPDRSSEDKDRESAKRYAQRQLNAGKLSPDGWAELHRSMEDYR